MKKTKVVERGTNVYGRKFAVTEQQHKLLKEAEKEMDKKQREFNRCQDKWSYWDFEKADRRYRRIANKIYKV